MINKGMMTSNSNDWATPQKFFDEWNEVFKFETDVCASAKNAKCKQYFNENVDGLKQKWIGVCWCNPPYGRKIGKWVEKAYKESQINDSTVVLLLPARTDTRWFHDYIYNKHDVVFIKGRLKFNDGDNPAPFPSMIVIMRTKKVKCEFCGKLFNDHDGAYIYCDECTGTYEDDE